MPGPQTWIWAPVAGSAATGSAGAAAPASAGAAAPATGAAEPGGEMEMGRATGEAAEPEGRRQSR